MLYLKNYILIFFTIYSIQNCLSFHHHYAVRLIGNRNHFDNNLNNNNCIYGVDNRNREFSFLSMIASNEVRDNSIPSSSSSQKSSNSNNKNSNSNSNMSTDIDLDIEIGVEKANLQRQAITDTIDEAEVMADDNTITRGATMHIDESHAQIDLLYDSDCPLCMMEVEFLLKRDINHMIKFTDLQSPSYDPAEHGNVKFTDGMRKIRAVLPDGQIITGVDVFQKTYEAIGLGWIFSLTKIPFMHDVADRIYDYWAENRLRLTGREDLAQQLRERSQRLRETEIDECDTDACGLDFSDLED